MTLETELTRHSSYRSYMNSYQFLHRSNKKPKENEHSEQKSYSQCRNSYEFVAGTPSLAAMRLLLHIALACRSHMRTFHT